jgi:gliding motility-associated-like protein
MKTLVSILFLFAGITVFGQQTNITFSAANNNQTFSTCNGFIIDSGGQGGPGYGNGENTVITICPGTPGDIISIVFNLFQLSTTDDNPAPNITNVDYMDVYDGASTASPTLGTYTGSQLQGVVINATALNPSGCITLRFRSNTVGTGMFSASATCETPCATPIAGGIIAGGETSDSTRVCVGEPVNFANMGSFAQPGFTITDYHWDFMDGSTANGANVSHTFWVPGQYLVELFVTDDNNCGNTNLIDLQVFVATIPDFTGFPGDTTLCIGESVQFTADPESYEVIWDGFNGSQTIDDGCLPDTLLGVSQDIEIMQTGFTPGATLTQLSDIQGLCLDLEHSFMGDLVIIVQCPNGQSQILHQQGGGGTQIGEPNPLDNVDCSDPTTQGVPYTYCFTPVATDTWVEWANASGFGTIPAGDYEPVQPFTNLLGCPLNGIWTLTVIDNWAADDGTLFSFDINLDPSLYPPVTVFEPQIGHGADSSFWSMPANFATVSTNGDVLTIVPTTPGTNTYVYNVIDNYGCQHDTSVTVTVNANPQADAGPDVTICNGTPVELAGSIIGGNINCNYTINLDDSFGDGWNGNNLLVTINGVTTSYTIPTGSSATFSIPVTNGETISFQFDGAGSFLGECSYEILDAAGNVVFTDGGNFNSPSTAVQQLIANCLGNLTYSWTPPGILSNPAINNPVVTTGTNTTLTFTVYPTGHPLCATSDQVNVNISASANPGTNNILSICSQGTPTDLFPLLGPNASVLGTWTNPAGAPVNMPYDPVTMNPGIYTYSVDSNGCISQATVTVTEVSPTINIVPTNISCHGSSDGSAVVTTANATTYSLDGGAQQPITGSPFTLTGLTLGSHTVDIFGVGGCDNTMTFNITEPPALSITNISPDDVLCPGENTTVQATGAGGSTAYTYTWTANNAILGTGTPFTINNVTQTTNYCVILTEACGSTPATACMTITVPQPLNLVITPDDPDGCYPHTVQFTNNTTSAGNVVGSTINYGDGTPEVTTVGLASFTHQFAEPGVYTVTITSVSDSGCVYSQTFTNMITVYDDPVAGFILTPNPTTFFQTHVNLLNASSSDVVSYSWSMPGGSPAQSTNENAGVDYPEGEIGTYPVLLTVTNAAGCTDTITKYVQVLSEVILYAPNTFTPDGDEFNQNWFLYIEGIDVTAFNLKVYNRWGEVVWENNDPQGSWDGTYGGKIVQDGTYNWILETKDQISDKKYTFNGHITITK